MFLIFVIAVVVVPKFCCTSLAVADANLQIRGVGGGGGHPDPEIRGGGGQKNIFWPFGSQLGLNIRGDPGPSGPSPGYATD